MGAIYLIRHGQASFGKSDYDQLSDTGVRQSTVLGEALREQLGSVDRVLTGGMRRHLQTAEATLAAIGIAPEIHEDRRWAEFDHEQVIVRHKPIYRSRAVMAADLARKRDSRRAFQLLFDEALGRWAGATVEGEYTEAWPDFISRCMDGLESLGDTLGSGQTALVFTSGGPVSAIASRLTDASVDGWLRLNRATINCGVTKVVTGRSGASLVTYNGHAHFEGAKRDLQTYR